MAASGTSIAPRTSYPTRRRRRGGTRKRLPSELGGPKREVVYIFERTGTRGGAIWWLVLECGHAVARKRYEAKDWSAMVHAMFRPLSEKLAPKRCQCHYCAHGTPRCDPQIMIDALGRSGPATVSRAAADE